MTLRTRRPARRTARRGCRRSCAPPATTSTTASGCTFTAVPIRSGCSTWPSSCCTPQHDAEHQQRDPRAVVDEREEDGERTGDDRADDRDERAEEDEHGDRDRERHAEEERAEADADRVDRGHEDLRARVVDDGDPAGAARAVDGRARLAREEPSVQRQMPPPSARMHSRMKSASSAPATTWPSVVPSASAPDSSSSACSWMQGRAPATRVVDLRLGEVQRAVERDTAGTGRSPRPCGPGRKTTAG